ncbi:MAG: hypothetical protein CFE21_17005 [Bacteroidetes bacterium B1(2017)]|nr:MAG: hypothetical protein CFE21_17005 [Bacteroidetes bacterium B1(2017)]
MLVACKKDIDLKKFDNLTISSELGIPLAVVDMKMSDLLKQDSNVVYDPDGFIHFIIREDSIASFPVDSFVKLPDLAPVTVNTKLGLIDITDITISETKTLGELADNFSSTTKAALQAANGTVSIFPSINDQNNNITSLPLNASQFASVRIANGFLVIDFKNQLKVTIDQVKVNIFNTVPFQTLVGQLVFNNIPPSSSKKDSLNLSGVTLSSSLAYSLPTFRTFASSSPVLIDLNDGVKLDVTTKGMKASGGTAIFPDQTINAQDLKVDLKADDPTVRIRHVEFESGMINYSVASNIDEQLSIKITIQGATKNAVPLAPILINVKNQTKTGTIDLKDVLFDLTLDGTQPYNKMSVKVEPRLISSNVMKDFDSSNYVNASFTFGTLKFKEVNGYLGNRDIAIDVTEQTFDFLEQFDKGFPLDDPKIKILSSNSIGVPVSVTLDAEGTSAKGAKQKLNASPFIIGYPSTAQKGQVISDTKVIDKSNSSLLALLNLPPTRISFGGKASINAGGFTGAYNDFIVKGSGIAVGFEIDMPLSLKTNNFVIEQTSDNPLFDIKNGKIDKTKLGTDSVEYVDLILKIDNGIPLEMKLDMFFATQDTVISDSIIVGTLMQSAIADANGRTTKNTLSSCTVRIPREKMDAIRSQNLTKMVVRMTVISASNGTQVSKIYSNYTTRIGISAKVKLRYNYKKTQK